MINRLQDVFYKSDYFLFIVLLFLLVSGFFAIYSAVYDTINDVARQEAYKQLQFILLGFFIYFVISLIGYRNITNFALPLYILGCITLLIVILKGSSGMGAQRWLMIGPYKFQPSELFKWGWIITLGWVFSDIEPKPIGFMRLIRKFIWVIPPFILIYFQPDLGTALIYLCVWTGIVVYLGVQKRTFFILLLVFIVSSVAVTPYAWERMRTYQKKRVLSFFMPEKFKDENYQAKQSKVTIGSGGITGKGYLKGTQSHLNFMPIGATDFIFSVINEEFGFVGGGLLLLAFFLLVTRILIIGMIIKEPQGKIICVGAASLLMFHLFINIGMTVGIMPVVGIPLPFISYGGSSMITFMAIMGLINSVYISRYDKNV